MHAYIDEEQILREEQHHEFMNKINQNLDFPIEAIQKIVMMKLKEFDQNAEVNFTNSKLAKMFA